MARKTRTSTAGPPGLTPLELDLMRVDPGQGQRDSLGGGRGAGRGTPAIITPDCLRPYLDEHSSHLVFDHLPPYRPQLNPIERM
ncbi:MAG: hypothetical protein WCK89_10165 [bacterium]